MNQELLQLTNMCIQLLQVVQKEVAVEVLPKDFWITLGMAYNTYRYNIQENPDLNTVPNIDVTDNQENPGQETDASNS